MVSAPGHAGGPPPDPDLVQIVAYDGRHAKGVPDLILGIQQREFGMPLTIEDQPDLVDVAAFYQAGDGNFWVATHGAEVVGTIGLRDIGDGNGALRKMFVAPAWRGGTPSVAQRLLATLLAHARSRHIAHVYLGTTPWFHAAHRFYERHGFTEVPQTDLPAAFPVMKVDTRFYRIDTAP